MSEMYFSGGPWDGQTRIIDNPPPKWRMPGGSADGRPHSHVYYLMPGHTYRYGGTERDTDADTLRCAADLLESRAAEAGNDRRELSAVRWDCDYLLIRDHIREPSARWIALMNPTVAAPLAAWLRGVATDAEQIGPNPQAVSVARTLLGTEEH